MLTDWHSWEVESEQGREAIGRPPVAGVAGRRVISTNHHAQGSLGSPIQGGKMPRGTGAPSPRRGLCLSWLHKQASCLPASSASSIAPGGPGLPFRVLPAERQKGYGGGEGGWGLLMGIIVQILPNPGRAVGPPHGPSFMWSHALHPLAAICFLSRLSTSLCVWSQLPRKITLPTNTKMVNFIHSLSFLNDLENGHGK